MKAAITEGKLHLVFTTPEKLQGVVANKEGSFNAFLARHVEAIIVDESHMGDDPNGFREEGFGAVARFRDECCISGPMGLLTATPYPDRTHEMCQILGAQVPPEGIIKTPSRRSNLFIKVFMCIHIFIP